MAIELIHFKTEMPKEKAFLKFYRNVLKDYSKIHLNHIVTNARGSIEVEQLHKWLDFITTECFYEDPIASSFMRKRLAVKDNGTVIGQILCEIVYKTGFHIEYYDVDEKGNERHNSFLISKLSLSFKELAEAYDVYKLKMVYTDSKKDFLIDNDYCMNALVNTIKEVHPNFKGIFDTINGYKERADWLKDNIDLEYLSNDSSKLDKGIIGYEYGDSHGLNIHYEDDKYNGKRYITWWQLEDRLYEEYGIVDIIGKEKYTDDEVFEMLKESVTTGHGSGFANYHERMVKIYEHFIQKDASKKERVEWVKKEFGTQGGFSKPMHKDEYGYCGCQSFTSGHAVCYKEAKGRTIKPFPWNTIDDILLDYVKELKNIEK